MPYISSVNGQSYQLEPQGENQPVQQIALDGQDYSLDWQQIAGMAGTGRGGHYSLLIAGQSYDIYARNITRAGEKAARTYEIILNGQRFEVKIEDERTQLLGHLAAAGNSTGLAQVEAPMPGLVIGLPYEVGAQILSGQTVVVLEAMKMENDLVAPIDGIVKELRVSKGQTVDQGEVLVVIEAGSL